MALERFLASGAGARTSGHPSSASMMPPIVGLRRSCRCFNSGVGMRVFPQCESSRARMLGGAPS